MTTLNVILFGIIILLGFLFVNKNVRDVAEKVFTNHKSLAITIYLLLGVVCYIICYHFYTDDGLTRTLIMRLGDLLIIGVLVGFITNAARFYSIFQNSQIKSLYSVEEIKNRKDLYKIWGDVSEAVFKSRFPKIKNQLLKIVNDYYFPNSEKGYYDNYVCEYHLKFIDAEKQYLQSDEHITYTYMTDTKGKISMETCSWVNYNASHDGPCCSDIVSFKVDGKQMLVGNNVTTSREGNLQVTTIKVDLSGKKSYNIEIEYKKIVKFDEDHDIGFSARRITNKLTTMLHYSDDITVYFRKSGTINEFLEQKFDHALQVKYDGLILPRQGYVFVLGRS